MSEHNTHSDIESDSDFVTILSSELIATVVEQYFNDVMYKVPVRIVDLKPTSDGYAFSLAFVTEAEQHTAQQVRNDAAIAAIEEFYKHGKALTDEEVAAMEQYSGNNDTGRDEISSAAYARHVKSGNFKKSGSERDKKGRFTVQNSVNTVHNSVAEGEKESRNG